MLTSGIYKIICLWTAKVYVGSAINLATREQLHFNRLRRDKHENSKLQNAWNKYGEELFEFQVIEECKKEQLIEREQYWIDYYSATKLGFNICPIAYSRLGTSFKHTEEAKRKIALARSGKKMSEANKLELLLVHQGSKRSDDTKHKMSAAAKNHPNNFLGCAHSSETKRKISEALIGNKPSQSNLDKRSLSMKRTLARKKLKRMP